MQQHMDVYALLSMPILQEAPILFACELASLIRIQNLRLCYLQRFLER